MTKTTLQEALKYLKLNGKRIYRKHVTQYGFYMYQHPTVSSAIIMVKDDKIIGQTNKVKILQNNSNTIYKLENSDFLQFTL